MGHAGKTPIVESLNLTERIFKAQGLVLRTRVLGEADRLVTLLTREEGKFEAVARGARKTKSRLAAGVDLFACGSFTFHRGKTWPVITGIAPLANFFWFRDDPDRYSCGIYIAELTDRLLSGKEMCEDIFDLVFESWRLYGEKIDLALLCRAFELKLARAAGYCPHLQSCVLCGSARTAFFNPRQGGLICTSCRSAGTINLEPGSIPLMKRLINAPLSGIKMIRVTPRQKKDLAAVTASFFAYQLDLGDIKSRRMLPD